MPPKKKSPEKPSDTSKVEEVEQKQEEHEHEQEAKKTRGRKGKNARNAEKKQQNETTDIQKDEELKEGDPVVEKETGTKRRESDTKQAGASKKRKANDEEPQEGEKSTSRSSRSKAKANENSKNTDGTIGSKHMNADEPAQRGSADRLPKKGQKAFWKAMPGIVEGTVQEVLTQGKSVDGKNVKASKDDPKIVLKSSAKSGKICVHKPDACFYD